MSDIVEELREQAHRMSSGPMMATVRGRVEWEAAEEIADLRAQLAEANARAERAEFALKTADAAINPRDKSGISMHVWNERLKAATEIIRQALSPEPQEPEGGCTCLPLPEPPDDNCPLHGEQP